MTVFFHSLSALPSLVNTSWLKGRWSPSSLVQIPGISTEEGAWGGTSSLQGSPAHDLPVHPPGHLSLPVDLDAAVFSASTLLCGTKFGKMCMGTRTVTSPEVRSYNLFLDNPIL